jgi:hypothetical protein
LINGHSLAIGNWQSAIGNRQLAIGNSAINDEIGNPQSNRRLPIRQSVNLQSAVGNRQ